MTTIKLDLTGFYTYTTNAVIGDDGTMPKFGVTINEADSTIQGTGSDHPGRFAIAGILVGDEIRFVKQYINSNGNVAWKYIGKRLEPKGNVYQFTGAWGQGSWQGGQWVLSGVAAPPPQKPHHPIEGQWSGTYQYANNINQKDGPMNLTISLDESIPYKLEGPFAIAGTGTDGIGSFTIKGTLAQSGDLDVQKTYNVNGRVWTWRYQGLYDRGGAIGGIWRQINDDEASPLGSFSLTQKKDIPKATAQAIIPQSRSLFSANSNNSIASAVQAISSRGTQVPAATLQSLLNGFASM